MSSQIYKYFITSGMATKKKAAKKKLPPPTTNLSFEELVRLAVNTPPLHKKKKAKK